MNSIFITKVNKYKNNIHPKFKNLTWKMDRSNFYKNEDDNKYTYIFIFHI